SERSPTSSHTSSKLLNAKRKPPAVKNPLPPRHASGAFSTTSVRAPSSRAESAAHIAALPPPTTITSYDVAIWTPSAEVVGRGYAAGRRAVKPAAARSAPRRAGHLDQHGAALGGGRHLVGGRDPRAPAAVALLEVQLEAEPVHGHHPRLVGVLAGVVSRVVEQRVGVVAIHVLHDGLGDLGQRIGPRVRVVAGLDPAHGREAAHEVDVLHVEAPEREVL